MNKMNLYLNKESNPDKLILTFYDTHQNCEKRVCFTLNKIIREDWDLRLRHYNSYEYFDKDEHLPGHDNTDIYWKELKGCIFICDENNKLKVVKENEGVKWNPEFLGMKRFSLDERTNKFFRSDRSMAPAIPDSNRIVDTAPHDIYEIILSKTGILPPDIGA